MITMLVEWVSVTVVTWLRDPNTPQDTDTWTPRNIRDTILRMLPDEQIVPEIARRIANDLTRWIGDEDGYIRVRYQEDSVARRAVQRVVQSAIEHEGAEADDDITSDECAITYPKIFEWIQMVGADLRGLTRELKRLGRRPKSAKELLLLHVRHSADDGLASI